MDFGVFATPSSNWARRKYRPLPPDADGLFDAEAVTVICGRRQCFFDVAGDLFGHVQFKETRIPLTAIAPGRWDPVAVLAACTRAQGNQVCEVDYATAKPSNPDGLDEIKIARAWAPTACGRTYRKRAVFRGPVWCVASVERPLETEDGFRNTFRASAGKPTWAFRTLLWDRRGRERATTASAARCALSKTSA